MTRTILMLQALAAERGAAAGGAEQEAARALIGGRPDQIADALPAEHRVVNVERQHRQIMRRIAGGCRNPGADRAGLGDAFLQDLAALRFAVVKH